MDSNEAIWQRIYPQENGLPVISPTGKYWVKLRFMGKERLVEIDDRMPCSNKGLPILPRTSDHNEIWPQILTKALLKVYSYKWYDPNCQYDLEIGDGSIVYSLTGLMPEHIPITSNAQAQALFRKHLSDEFYFGKKTFLTCFCENEHRPKFPSQANLLAAGHSGLIGSALKAGPGSRFDYGYSEQVSDTESQASYASSSGMMLRKFKEAASLAISVTTGRKPAFGPKEKSLTNIIPGFGYALMDVFENQFVDMSSITRAGDRILEENTSPFASPSKSKHKRERDTSVTKEERKRIRREMRKREQEERERREQQPPVQYSFVKIKTSIGKHPVINYLSTFTNDEITEGKKHLLNRWRRDPSKPVVQNRSPSPGKRPAGGEHFKLEVSEAKTIQEEHQDAAEPHTPSKAASAGALQPKPRAPGGIWLAQSDFPFAFQHVIVYHNPKKYSHVEMHQDIWEHGAEPYVSNHSDVYIKLELDPEAAKKVQSEERFYSRIGIKDSDSKVEGGVEEAKEEVGDGTKSAATARGLLPGEREHIRPEHDDILIGFAPYPSNRAAAVIPRYLTHLRQVDRPREQEADMFDHIFRSYFGAVQFHLNDAMASQSCIWLKPEFNCPMGTTMWVAG